jgi:hypothetical protein
MLQFFRDVLKFKMPHPSYGRCGGSDLVCSEDDDPIDSLDRLFQEHDMNFELIDHLMFSLWKDHFIPMKCNGCDFCGREVVEVRHKLRKEADEVLYLGLKRLNPKKLSWYGRLYRWGAMKVFKP